MSRRVLVVHNARKPAAPVEALVRALAGHRVEVVRTGTLAEGRAICAEAVAAGVDRIVAAGGDGTLLTAVDAAAGSPTEVGVLPLGHGNDLARHLGWRRPEHALAALVEAPSRPVDAFELRAAGPTGPVVWTGCTTAGAGLFAEVVARELSPGGQRLLGAIGPTAWLAFTVREGLLRRPVPATLTLDGVARAVDLLSLDLFKVPAMGGFPFAPAARLDSGGLHGWCGGLPGVGARLGALFAGLRRPGAHLDREDVVPIGHRDPPPAEVALATPDPVRVHVHGELVGTTPVRVVVRPGALRLVAP